MSNKIDEYEVENKFKEKATEISRLIWELRRPHYLDQDGTLKEIKL